MFDLKFDPVEHIYHTKGPNDPDWVETPSVSTFISPLYGSGKSYFTPESALRGTRVHLATELDDLGKLDHLAADAAAGRARFPAPLAVAHV